MQSEDPAKAPESPPRKATVAQVAGAVFWSFLGIRKRRDYDADAASISATQAIIAGIIGALVLVVALVVLVRFITR